jgi:HupE / UreJ protein
MTRLAALALVASHALAHAISMSSGDLTIHGTHAHYELHMPLYELAHLPDAGHALFDNLRLTASGQSATLLHFTCQADAPHATYTCEADYEFPTPVETLDVQCNFPRVTVPNHVHLLRAENDGKRDQAIFDISFPTATLRFRPPTAVEQAVTEGAAGIRRVWGSFAQMLFLAALALAARGRRELMLLAAMFISGQTASALFVRTLAWQPSPRFAEAAAALTVAYLAIEILLLSKAGARWAIVALLGGFHGLYFEMLLRATGYHALYVLPAAACAELVLIAILAALFGLIERRLTAWKPVPVCASLLSAIGMVWFLASLRR